MEAPPPHHRRAAVELKQKMIIRNTGSEDLAVYFMGALHEGDLCLWDGSETLNDIVSRARSRRDMSDTTTPSPCGRAT